MRIKNILISLLAIGIVVILPHTGIIPNFGYSIPILFFVWLYLKYSNETFSDIGFSFKLFNLRSILIGSIVAGLSLCFMQFIFFPVLEYFIVFEETDVELYNFIRKNKWNYLFIIIMGWLVGGLYEEIVLHGFIFSRLEKMINGKYASLIVIISVQYKSRYLSGEVLTSGKLIDNRYFVRIFLASQKICLQNQ